MRFEPRSSGQLSNACTSEPKSRLPDAVCRRLYLYDMYRIPMLFIEATHHTMMMAICQSDPQTTADNVK